MNDYLYNIFVRTLVNCVFYEKAESWNHLLDECGCLRGISYAISDDLLVVASIVGDDNYEKFLHFMSVKDYLIKEFDKVYCD